YHFVIAVWRAKEAESNRVKYLEIIADNLSKAGCSWGCVSAVDCEGRTIWIADAHRDEGKRSLVRGAAFLGLLQRSRAPNGFVKVTTVLVSNISNSVA